MKSIKKINNPILKISIFILFLILIIGWCYIKFKNAENKEEQISVLQTADLCKAPERAVVARVVDGDTIVVEGDWHIRLLEIDTDEIGEVCYDNAKQRLEELVLNKEVVLEKDRSDVDKYGRCLRTVFLNGTNIDLQLVTEGLAVSAFYEPDIKYKSEILQAENQAQQNKVGCKYK